MAGSPKTPQHLLEASQREASAPVLGTVQTVDPLAHSATMLGGKDDRHEHVPILGMVGPDGEGHFDTPMPGWRGTLTDELGFTAFHHGMPSHAFSRGDLPPENDEYDDVLNTWLTLTGTPTVYRSIAHKSRNYRSHRPADLIAGDLGFRTAEGSSVFALRGGVAGMKASDLCQFILSQVDDLARLVTRNFDLFSDWGTIQLVNENGKTALKVRGNAKAENTYADKFDFELSLGSGENFMSLTLLDKASEAAVYTVVVDQKGNQHVYLKKDLVVEIEGNQAVGITKNQKLIVGGKQDVEVDESSIETIGTKKTIKSPKVHLGAEGGEKAPMGQELKTWLEDLVLWIDTKMLLQSPSGPCMTVKVSAGPPPPAVPDFLSSVVDYIKKEA